MTGFAILGAVLVAAIVAAGIYWIIDHITFKKQPSPYSYTTDAKGNEIIKDNSDETP